MPISTLTHRVSTDTLPSLSIGTRIKEWRRSRGMTQKGLASILEVDNGTLRKYELGLIAPGALVLQRLCAQGANINWVLTGQESMLRKQSAEITNLQAEPLLFNLRDRLQVLQIIDENKFVALARGFTERTQEAVDMANLERQLASKKSDVRTTRPTNSGAGSNPNISFDSAHDPEDSSGKAQ